METATVAYDPDRLRSFIQGMDQIPTLPAVASRLLRMVEDPQVSLKDISDLMSNDPALSARVLKLVNSAFFGLPRTVASIREAVVLLGLMSIRKICLSVSVMGAIKASSDAAKGAMERVWKHSLAAGLAGRLMAGKVGLMDPEEAFTCGLLHDIGRVLLIEYAPKETLRAAVAAEKQHISILEAEILHLGFDHRHVGGWIASHWKLPGQVAKTAAWHHSPDSKQWEDPQVEKLVTIVAVANEVANFKNLHFAKAAPDISLMPALESLNLDPSELMSLTEDLEDEVKEFYRALS